MDCVRDTTAQQNQRNSSATTTQQPSNSQTPSAMQTDDQQPRASPTPKAGDAHTSQALAGTFGLPRMASGSVSGASPQAGPAPGFAAGPPLLVLPSMAPGGSGGSHLSPYGSHSSPPASPTVAGAGAGAARLSPGAPSSPSTLQGTFRRPPPPPSGIFGFPPASPQGQGQGQGTTPSTPSGSTSPGAAGHGYYTATFTPRHTSEPMAEGGLTLVLEQGAGNTPSRRRQGPSNCKSWLCSPFSLYIYQFHLPLSKAWCLL